MKRFSMAMLVTAVALAGCSSFENDFSKQSGMAAAAKVPAEGAWVGRWQSNKGHGGGELRAIIEPKGTGSLNTAQVLAGRFKAKWGFFTTEYVADVQTESDITRASTVKVHVTYDLGFFGGGQYTMNGECSEKKFSATYKSTADEGTIEMTRPQ